MKNFSKNNIKCPFCKIVLFLQAKKYFVFLFSESFMKGLERFLIIGSVVGEKLVRENGLFQKETKQKDILKRYFFDRLRRSFLKKPWIFLVSYFAPRNSRQNKASPLEILQNCVRPLRNSKAKNQNLWKFHMIFS